MNNTAAPQELEALARRMIWWKPADESLRFPDRLLAQVMAIGTWEDVQLAKRVWSRDEFIAVLKHPPVGVFDARSWAYWHRVLGVLSVPSLPERQLA
jgi:hypothetical protein